MGRRIQFEREEALTKATELFWRRGYVNTSLAQLLKAMKIGEGSFYNSFKSKKRLYLECLQHYGTTVMKRHNEALSAPRSAKQRLGDFFDVVIESFAERETPGCLISNSLTHEVLSERELKGYLFGEFDSFLSYLQQVVVDGQRRHELNQDLDPPVVARILLTYLHGLHRLSVYDLDPARRRAETRAFIDAILPA